MIPADAVILDAILRVPRGARGIVLFAHGSGSSRFSPRNRRVAQYLNMAGFATVLADLLTPDEEGIDRPSGHLRFDIAFLASRLHATAEWLMRQPELSRLPRGYFGASTGAAAALVAAAAHPDTIRAVVSRGGRPDLASAALPLVRAPTLLLVGSRDPEVLTLNEQALAQLSCVKSLIVVPGASHLFEEPGTLDAVARAAADWFDQHLHVQTR
ncbi:dienelactone hydrolase family protein [Methylobacterium sp. NEAU K]|uniref:dienelactone hydrolase family protein n=1 Tax=Methylobacterium sp. NEAU K TaxID=3064946 RepID=UPI002735304C|nr:alpha/beta fold hydrolase [Methylobacterium sp. NEAU K]MDP4002667.1 dienelactone hydrolase family protein [Methylobacterium sp. NEAU K]